MDVTVSETYPTFGATLATVVIGTVVLNEATGEAAPTDELMH